MIYHFRFDKYLFVLQQFSMSFLIKDLRSVIEIINDKCVLACHCMETVHGADINLVGFSIGFLLFTCYLDSTYTGCTVTSKQLTLPHRFYSLFKRNSSRRKAI